MQITNPAGRNLRSVWEITTQSFTGAHFAVFPEKLPEICIKASTSEYGVCSKCGSQWARVVEHKNMVIDKSGWAEDAGIRILASGTMVEPAETSTLGWKPTCKCKDARAVPATVLDPFAGTGTTGKVVVKLGRHCIMFELSEEYCKLLVDRNRQLGLG